MQSAAVRMSMPQPGSVFRCRSSLPPLLPPRCFAGCRSQPLRASIPQSELDRVYDIKYYGECTQLNSLLCSVVVLCTWMAAAWVLDVPLRPPSCPCGSSAAPLSVPSSCDSSIIRSVRMCGEPPTLRLPSVIDAVRDSRRAHLPGGSIKLERGQLDVHAKIDALEVRARPRQLACVRSGVQGLLLA